MNPPPTKPYPLRFKQDLLAEIDSVAEATKLPRPDTIRQAIWLGLPVLKKKMNKERK